MSEKTWTKTEHEATALECINHGVIDAAKATRMLAEIDRAWREIERLSDALACDRAILGARTVEMGAAHARLAHARDAANRLYDIAKDVLETYDDEAGRPVIKALRSALDPTEAEACAREAARRDGLEKEIERLKASALDAAKESADHVLSLGLALEMARGEVNRLRAELRDAIAAHTAERAEKAESLRTAIESITGPQATDAERIDALAKAWKPTAEQIGAQARARADDLRRLVELQDEVDRLRTEPKDVPAPPPGFAGVRLRTLGDYWDGAHALRVAEYRFGDGSVVPYAELHETHGEPKAYPGRVMAISTLVHLAQNVGANEVWEIGNREGPPKEESDVLVDEAPTQPPHRERCKPIAGPWVNGVMTYDERGLMLASASKTTEGVVVCVNRPHLSAEVFRTATEYEAMTAIRERLATWCDVTALTIPEAP